MITVSSINVIADIVTLKPPQLLISIAIYKLSFVFVLSNDHTFNVTHFFHLPIGRFGHWPVQTSSKLLKYLTQMTNIHTVSVQRKMESKINKNKKTSLRHLQE